MTDQKVRYRALGPPQLFAASCSLLTSPAD
jgi:hypothetical protein